jgi:hypothetical protein
MILSSRALAALVCLSLAGAGQAQESSHQRLSVGSEAKNQIEAGLDATWRPSSLDLSTDLSASVEYTWNRSFSLGLAMPVSGEYKSAERKGERSKWRWGDPRASLSRLWHGAASRAQCSLGYSYPLPHEEPGFHELRPSASVALIRDPVMLSAGTDLVLRFPAEASGYLVWPPLSGGLSLSAWELLNDRVSYRVSLSPSLSFKALRVGLDDELEPRWSLSVAVSVSWDERAWGLRTGWCGDVAASSAYGMLDAGASYRKEW